MQIHYPNQQEIQAILEQPGYIPWHIDGKKSQVLFRKLDEQSIYAAAFLDQRLSLRQQESTYAVPVQALMNEPVNCKAHAWIFHTSFCASTLLARLLQIPEKLLVVREPLVLNQLADAFRSRPGNSAAYLPLLQSIAAQLSKPFHSDQQVIIKTSNYMNALLNQVHRMDDTTRVLLVWGDLQSFIRSMYKNREEAIKNVPVFLRALKQDARFQDDYIPGAEFWRDVAYLWAVQVDQFNAYLKDSPLPAATLNKQQITRTPELTVAACDRFLKTGSGRNYEELSDIMDRDSKRQSSKPSVSNTGEMNEEDENEFAAIQELALKLIPDEELSTLQDNAL